MRYTSLITLILILSGVIPAVSLAATTDTSSSEAQIAITSYQLDPEIFMPGDAGTLKVKITNTGSQPIAIDRVDLISENLKVGNYQVYDKVGTLGAGNSLDFTFMLEAGNETGTFFPLFYVDFTNAGSMRYPVPVKVDDTGIFVSVIDAPDTFSAGNKDNITLSVSNPRENAINSVAIVPAGQGIKTEQSGLFLGTIGSDVEKKVTFGITPSRETVLVFTINYQNGPNKHATTIALPITMGDRRMSAELVVNNIEVAQSGRSVTLTGDVTNAGLEDAKSVMVTVGDPAKPVDPNPIYVIGALEPDDFSSFEVTCTVQEAPAIPLIIQYRDTEGKLSEETVLISLDNPRRASSASGSTAGSDFPGNPGTQNRRPGGFFSFGNGVGKIPFVEIIIVIIVCIGGLVAWRKGYLRKIRNKIAKR